MTETNRLDLDGDPRSADTGLVQNLARLGAYVPARAGKQAEPR